LRPRPVAAPTFPPTGSDSSPFALGSAGSCRRPRRTNFASGPGQGASFEGTGRRASKCGCAAAAAAPSLLVLYSSVGSSHIRRSLVSDSLFDPGAGPCRLVILAQPSLSPTVRATGGRPIDPTAAVRPPRQTLARHRVSSALCLTRSSCCAGPRRKGRLFPPRPLTSIKRDGRRDRGRSLFPPNPLPSSSLGRPPSLAQRPQGLLPDRQDTPPLSLDPHTHSLNTGAHMFSFPLSSS
jgi:hypothetical protein